MSTLAEALPDGTAAPAPAAVVVEDLYGGYEEATVLHGVSLRVDAGGAVALLGPNGAGKSTLLKSICGLLHTKKGKVELFGEDVTHKPAYKRFGSGVCLVPEGRGVFRSLTVRENLSMQAPRGQEGEFLERAVEAFPILGERMNQRAGTLSGGQQQMLAVSVVHARDPRLILVDEASLGLAPIIVDEIFEFLENVRSGGTALLIVDQFVARALAIADRAYVLRQGTIAFEGAAAELADVDMFKQYLGA